MSPGAFPYPCGAFAPRQPHDSVRGRRKGCLRVKDRNLLIPVEIPKISWGEVL